MKIIAAISMIFATVMVTYGSATVENYVATMIDKTATWEARCAAEDSLTNFPPNEVLSVLLPHVGKGIPSPMVWNSEGRERDKRAPPEWQIFFAIARSWDRQVGALPLDLRGRILLSLLENADAAKARIQIIRDLTKRWVPEAEAPVAAILTTKDEVLGVRTTAALALIIHGTNDYHDLLLGYAQSVDLAEQKPWYELLSDPRHLKKSGVDPRVVVIGFSLIQNELKQSPNYIHGAYFLAITTGYYIGQEFKPDQKDTKYKGEMGLTDSFFADTVTNSIQWWTENKSIIEKSFQQPLSPR